MKSCIFSREFGWCLAKISEDVSVCNGLTAILNAKLLPAAITHLHRITVLHPSVDCSVRYSSVTIVCMGLEL